MSRNNWLAGILLSLLFLVYVTSYAALSRRGYAEAKRLNGVGFYYFSYEDTSRWRFMNGAARCVYAPLNALDVQFGTGLPPASDPMTGLQ